MNWRAVLSISRVTFLEISRERILYSSILSALVLLMLSLLAARLTFVRQDRVLMDFGIVVLTMICVFTSMLTAAPMISREIDRRTAMVALARPVTRAEFIAGKFAGHQFINLLNTALLGSVLYGFFVAFGGEFAVVHVMALLFVYLQVMIMGAVALAISSFSSVGLSVMASVGLFLAGSAVSQIRFVAEKSDPGVFQKALSAAAMLVPNLESLQLADKVTYGLAVTPAYFWNGVGYAVVATMLWVGVAVIGFRTREL